MLVHNIQLPEDIEQGAIGGPVWSTTISKLDSGRELANQNWVYPLHQFDIGYGDGGGLTPAQWQVIKAFFMCRAGMAIGFLFKDFSDYSVVLPNLFAVGNGSTTAFQLAKLYADGGYSYLRRITRPKTGTLIVTLNDVPTVAYTVNLLTGIITFSVAPGNGVNIKASFEFFVPVRFDSDILNISVIWEDGGQGAGAVERIGLLETRE